MDDYERLLEIFLEKFFNCYSSVDNKFVLDYLLSIFYMAQDYYFMYLDNFGDDIEYSDKKSFTNMTIKDKIDLIEDFYREYHLPYSIDDAINKGYVNIHVKDYDEINNMNMGSFIGLTYEDQGEMVVDADEYGKLVDSEIWVHELSHLNNTTVEHKPVNLLLTESQAFTMNFLFTDYLEEHGYKEDATNFRKDLLKIFFDVINYNYFNMLVFTIYNSVGSVNEKYAKMLFPELTDYQEILDRVFKNVFDLNTNAFVEFINAVRYTLAAYIAVYNISKFRDNKDFINNIVRFNDAIKNSDDVVECLKILGLPDIDTLSFHEIVDDRLDKFFKTLNCEKTYKKYI